MENDDTRVGEISEAVYARCDAARKAAEATRDPRARITMVLEADRREQETAVSFALATMSLAVTLANTALRATNNGPSAEFLQESLNVLLRIIPYNAAETSQYFNAMADDCKDMMRKN